MGKATIISEQGEGLYTIQPEWDTSVAQGRIARLTAENGEIDARLSTLDSEITSAEVAFFYASDVLQAAILNEAEQGEIDAKQRAVYERSAEVQNLRRTKSFLQLRKVANEKQIEWLESMAATPSTVQAWCADYTENLSGTVGTVEIGRVDVPPIILPGGGSPEGAMVPIASQSPAAAFYNLAMLPGAAKWRPRYRVGVASNVNKDNHTMSVTLEQVTISGLDCNAVNSLSSVPVNYMDCNADAFENGNRVLVNMQTKTVVGFANNPEACDPCKNYETDYPELTITGPELVDVGAVFTASGGKVEDGDYSWGSSRVVFETSGPKNDTATVVSFAQARLDERTRQQCKGSVSVWDDCASATSTILLKKRWVTQNGWLAAPGMDLKSERYGYSSPDDRTAGYGANYSRTLTPPRDTSSLVFGPSSGTHSSRCQLRLAPPSNFPWAHVKTSHGEFYDVVDAVHGVLPFCKAFWLFCPTGCIQDYISQPSFYFYHCVEAWPYGGIPFDRIAQAVQGHESPFIHPVHVVPRQSYYWGTGATNSPDQMGWVWYSFWDTYDSAEIPEGRSEATSAYWHWYLPPEDELPGGEYYQQPPPPPAPNGEVY